MARRAGKSYEELLAGTVCGPLGMRSTAITLTDELRSRLAGGHDADGKPAANWDLPTLAGAGAIRSTANDMLRFLSANLGPYTRKRGRVETPLAKAIQVSHVRRHEEKTPPIGIALAWHFNPGTTALWHNGQTGGYHCFAAFDTEQKTAVVVLSNSATMFVDELGSRLMELLAGKSPEPLAVRLPAKVDPALFDAYSGKYQLAPGFILTITREEDSLMAQATGQPKFRLFAQSETEFFFRVVRRASHLRKERRRASGRAGAAPERPRLAGKED